MDFSLDDRSNASTNSSVAGPSHQQLTGRNYGPPVAGRRSSTSSDSSSNTSGPIPKKFRRTTSPIVFDHGTASGSDASFDDGTSPIELDHGTSSGRDASSDDATSPSTSQESGPNQEDYNYDDIEVDVHIDCYDEPNVIVLVPMSRN